MVGGLALRGALAALLFGSPALAQVQNDNQQACLNKANKAGAAVAKAQGKEHAACLRAAGNGDLETPTAQACLTADLKGKVQKKEDKTVEIVTENCADVPNFGFISAATVNASAIQAEFDLLGDVFGANLDAAVINCDTNKDGCTCQQKVLKAVDKLAAKKVAEFLKCKKEVLDNGAASGPALGNCVSSPLTENSIAADTKGKIAKAIEGLNKVIADPCDLNGVTSGAFPGSCNLLTGTMLRDCLDVLVECRVCQMINDVDGLSVNCDTFDNGAADSSCASGAGPGPTFVGALPVSSGRFTYSAIVGLAGADATCNTNFAGSHACTITELLTAEAAGELVGAMDTLANPVTVFWVIDSTLLPSQQCHQTIPWDYATAHTGVGGTAATLTNATGDLGTPSSGLNCFQSKWVGCCQ
jgi:hypothetical protein